MRPHKNPYAGKTRDEIQAIEQAKRNMQIYLEAEKNMGPHENPHRGETWASMKARLCTPRQIAAARKFAEKVGREIEAREARERTALARQAQVGTRPAQREQRAAVGA